MQATLPTKWTDIQDSFTTPDLPSTLGFVAYLAIGGAMAMYIRFLYRRSSPQASNDSIARVFPLLTLVTIAVISVVKTSLALSLGLVGALSIVRFRAAIKDPEELVYLFLCIGIGLALGAEEPWLALALVVVASLFILVFDRLRPGARTSDAYLTVIGDAARYFGDGDDNALAIVQRISPRVSVQRCEVEDGEGQLRVHLHRVDHGGAAALIADLRTQLPECQISYVSAASLL